MKMIPASNRLIFGFGYGKILEFDTMIEAGRDVSNDAEGHKGMITSLGITPDGGLAITGGIDGYMRLWHLNDMNDRFYVKGFDGSYVSGVDITPDGRFAVMVSLNNALILWDIKKWEMVAMYLAPACLTCVAIFSSGENIVCGTMSGELIMLKLKNFNWIN